MPFSSGISKNGIRMSFQRILFFFGFLGLLGPLHATSSNDDFLEGFDLYAHKDYAHSIPYLKTALQSDPENWKAYQILGYDYYLSNQQEQALFAFDQSLRWHPNNPDLRNKAEGIRARIIWEAERNDIYPRVFRNYNIWVRLHTGVITASLGDLSKGAPAFRNYYTPIYGHATASVDGFGPLMGLEVGFMLDTYNAWGVVFDGAPLNGYKALAQDNFGNSLKGTIQPNMFSIQTEYYRFFKLGPTRLYANAGGGFYTTLVELSYTQNGVNLQSGELGGIGIGGFLGAGWEIAVADQISASFYARGRYATTGNLQGLITYGSGGSEMSVLSTDSTGVVSATPLSMLASTGSKAINVDYIGADLGLSITYHY
jgi:hypothetical protein